MAFKMKYGHNKKTGEGFPYKGEAFKYEWLNKLKTKASDTIQMLRDKTVNMGNLVGDPEFKAKMTASHKRDKQRAHEQSQRHKYQAQKRDKMQQFRKEYHETEGKQRKGESDKAYNRRYNDSKRHANIYAEAKYKKQKQDKITAYTPKTREQTQLADAKKKKPSVLTKKKYKK